MNYLSDGNKTNRLLRQITFLVSRVNRHLLRQKVPMRTAIIKLLNSGGGELRSRLMMLRYHVHLAKNVEDNLENPHDGEFLCMSFRETEYSLHGGTSVYLDR